MSKEKDPKEEPGSMVPAKQGITPPMPLAVVTQLTPQAKSLLHLTNDSTSVQLISLMGTIKAAPNIINAAGEVFSLERLRELARKKMNY